MRLKFLWCIVGLIAAVPAGLLMAEGLVRIATHPAIDYASLFRPGPYCLDPEIGITSACPGWTGFQRVPGEERYLRFTLGAFGERGPFSNGDTPGLRGTPGERRRTIVIVGGQSQGFGYGLADHDISAAVASRVTCGPVKIHNLGLVGIRNEVAWQTLEYKMLPAERVDHIVLALYWRAGDPDFNRIAAAYTSRMRFGAILSGWDFSLPYWFPPRLKVSALLVRLANHWHLPASTPTPEDQLVASLHEAARRAKLIGANFSVLLMPWGGPTRDGEIIPQLGDIRVIDANNRAWAENMVVGANVFPDGHYRPQLAALVGRMVGEDICAANFSTARK